MFHADSSAAIVEDGKILFAVAEERLNRHKHYGGFPALAVKACLGCGRRKDHRRRARRRGAGQRRQPREKSSIRAGESGESSEFHQDAAAQRIDARRAFSAGARARCGSITLKFQEHHLEHHIAHIASAYYCSPWEKAAGFSYDGSGDFVSTMMARCEGARNSGARSRVPPAFAGQFLHHDLRFHRLQKIWRRRQSHGPRALRKRHIRR